MTTADILRHARIIAVAYKLRPARLEYGRSIQINQPLKRSQKAIERMGTLERQLFRLIDGLPLPDQEPTL